MSRESDAASLDARILALIHHWHAGEHIDDTAVDALVLETFAHQLRYNAPYAAYCASAGVTNSNLPSDWRSIPPVPAQAFKESVLATFEPQRAVLVFETSGTTTGTGGKHFFDTRALYDAALLAGFERFVLRGRPELRYLMLVPNPQERPHSSLGYMMARVAERYGDDVTAWYLNENDVDVERFVRDVRVATAERTPVCIAATAFALVAVLDELAAHGVERLPLVGGSLIMETGGFKGRTRVVAREDLYTSLVRIFCIEPGDIIAEYGMTELTSQYYDITFPRELDAPRVKASPPWLRARVVGPNGRDVPDGAIGTLVHVDLANRGSCLAVQTQDLGAVVAGGIVLYGREREAELRGCSLDAESLRALQQIVP